MRQTPFIGVYIQGPRRPVYVGGCTACSVQEAYEGFDLVPTVGTFRLEPKMGNRKISGSITRYQPRGLGFKALVRSAYALPSSGTDMRMDMLPLQLIVTYTQVGVTYNYGAPLDTAQWLYAEVFFTDLGTNFASSANALVDETIRFMGQAEQYTEGTLMFQTQPYPIGGYANTGANAANPNSTDNSGNVTGAGTGQGKQ